MRLTKTFDKGGSYNVRFLPNAQNPSKSITELQYILKYILTNDSADISKRYFSYILRDNEATPVTYGMVIRKAIQQCMSGYIGTPDGRFITNDDTDDEDLYPNSFDKKGNLKYYFANADKTQITVDTYKAKESGLQKFDDMVTYSPRNPFDIRTGISLVFDTLSASGYLAFRNMRWDDTSEPLWDMSKQKSLIADLYNGVPSLDDVAESEVLYLKSSLKDGCELLTGDDAISYYHKNKFKTVK